MASQPACVYGIEKYQHYSNNMPMFAPWVVRFGGCIDPAFNHCVDGLVLVDIHQLKPKKRARYIGEALTIAAQS